MKKVVMLTAVPKRVAEELMKKHRVIGYNTLPSLNQQILKSVREFMTEHVGYSDLPMACLSKPSRKAGSSGSAEIGTVLSNYIPMNSKDCILFQLEMSEDLLVSVSFSQLLEMSNSANEATSEDEVEFICEMFKDELTLGVLDEDDQISFIPFLDYDKCKFYACMNKNFGVEEVTLPGIKQIDMRELTSFLD